MHLKGNKQQNLFWECDSAMIQICFRCTIMFALLSFLSHYPNDFISYLAATIYPVFLAVKQ